MVSCVEEPGNLTNLVVGVEILQDLKANPLAGRSCSNAVYRSSLLVFYIRCVFILLGARFERAKMQRKL